MQISEEIISKKLYQPSLDKEMLEEGRRRYASRVSDAQRRHIESNTSYGKQLLKHAVDRTAKKIEEVVTHILTKSHGDGTASYAYGYAAMLLHDKDLNQIAAITCKSVLDSVSIRVPMTTAATALSNMIIDEILADNISVIKGGTWKAWKEIQAKRFKNTTPRRLGRIVRKMAKDVENKFTTITNEEKVVLGMFLIDRMIEATGIVEVKTLWESKHRTRRFILPTQETTKWICDYNAWAEVLCPIYMPMVVKPEPWKVGKMYGGGYDIRGTSPRPLIKTRNRKYLSEMEGVEMPILVDSVNAIQNTPFRINTRVLDVMMDFWSRGDMVGDLLQYKEISIPDRPDRQDPHAYRAWARGAAETHGVNIANKSRSLAASKILYVANKFRAEPQIFFPHQIDFRGRAYAMPTFLHPQGNDLAKSLLLFSEGKPIKDKHSLHWLLIYGANLFGLDKRPYAERIAWVEKNATSIRQCAENPHAGRLWTEADSPWLFLAWCFEFSDFSKRGFGFNSSLPISLDATNNGLQVLSLLTRDEVGGLATNCIDSETPQDIYAEVAAATTKRLAADGTSNADMWLRFGIDRKTTKRPVMVFPYGGTLYSCRSYVEEWYLQSLRSGRAPIFSMDMLQKKTMFLANHVWMGIASVVGRAKEAMRFMQGLADACTAHNMPLRWTSPCGLPVLQEYFNTKADDIHLKLNGTVRRLRLREDTANLSKAKQKNAASPNIVHSLDASCLHLTVCNAAKCGIQHFAMVHDSYGTHAADIETLRACLNKSFVDTFSRDILADLREQVEKYVPRGTPIPPLPEYGTMSPSALSDSKYFFS